jgi:hypothetical protein
MLSRKKGLLISSILMVVLIISTAIAATASYEYYNSKSTYYYHTENCGSSAITAIGNNGTNGKYITQGFNGLGTNKVVYSYVSVINTATGYHNYVGKALVIKGANVCAAQLSRTLTNNDYIYHRVTKYNSTDATAYKSTTKIDSIDVEVYNNF